MKMKKSYFLILFALLISNWGFSQTYDFRSSFVGSSDSDTGNVNKYLKKHKKDSETNGLLANGVKRSKWFDPKLNIGAGFQVITALSQAPMVDRPGATHMNFTPAALQVGYLHADMQINSKLSAGFSWAVHSSSVCDAFIKFVPVKAFGIQVGRFKGIGNRGAQQTAIYDADLGHFNYISETQALDEGAPDTRFTGIGVFGEWKWMKYGFFWHKSTSVRTRYWSPVTNDLPKGNGGINMKSWDLSLGFTPIKYLEFGGHAASISRPGMGNRTLPSYSAYAYYVQPKRFKIKCDYVFYDRAVFDKPSEIAPDDYTYHDYHKEQKQGVSILAAAFVNKHIEPIASFEHFYEGKNSSMGYQALNLYTVGFNYYPFPDSPRVGRITAFYQKRSEVGGPKIRNDWFGVEYEIVLYGKIFGN